MSKSKHQIEEYKKQIAYLEYGIECSEVTIRKIKRKIRAIEHPYLKEG